MKPIEIFEMLKSENPELFANVPDKAAVAIIRRVVGVLGKQIAAADEGVVKVAGLGSFKIKQVEKEKEGEKVTVKRIMFTAAKPVDESKRPEGKTKRVAAKRAG